MTDKPSKLQKTAVMNWFTDRNNYLNYHSKEVNLEEIKHLIIEDEN